YSSFAAFCIENIAMVYSFDYDRRYDPAMPVAQVEIWYEENIPPLTMSAIIDSGADATIFPVTYLHQIRARKFDQVWMRGITAHRTPVDLYTVSLRVGSYTRHDVPVVADRIGSEVILGRDLMNHLEIILNGLAGVVEIVG